ncbi:bile acid:sodium symporter family protein [uncultured Megasphaera sp.]|uniref:bile acid:sodium symporter family protein n=1 Tax=uncultured Megasphaera sp. TaxID=165188 RepID=UPI00258E1D66|nr:bile acid:sodium symporter family protein [uncultured Megasphaera sp.]
MESLFKLVKFLTRYLTLWIILSAVVAFLMPAPFMHGDWIPYLIGCVMLSMGLSMTPGDFKLVLTRPRDVILGIIVISVCMPLVGLGIGTLLGLPPMLIVGLILVGCTPSGATSNVMTMISNGDKALSVTTSSLGTLISPFVTPALLMFYVGRYMPLDALAMFIGIIKIVIIPIALGLLIRKVFSKQMDTVLKLAPLLTVAGLP